MRLIDADALMKKIREVDFVADVDLMKITHDSMLTGFFHGSVQGIVDRLPTAYDPDKIVEQLKQLSIGTVLCDKCEYREKCDDIQEKYNPDDNTDLCTMVAKSLAIEIVKGGAV